MTPRSDHEEDMSMEEILASIRKFVTESVPDDKSKERVYKGDLAESVVIPPAGHEEEPSQPLTMRQSSPPPPVFQDKPDILELRNPVLPEKPNPGLLAEWSVPNQASVKKEPEESILVLNHPLETEKSETPTRFSTKMSQLTEQTEDSLSSPQAVTASAGSLSRLVEASKTAFHKKTSNLVDQRNLTLDQLIQDMVRPMVKQWIDTHLPSLVEEMVAKEIKRITKHLN